MHMTASHMNRGNHYFICCQLLHQITECGNVCYGIHGSYFMEMNLRNRFAMGFSFGLGYQPVNRQHMLFCLP